MPNLGLTAILNLQFKTISALMKLFDDSAAV
jgi:hypothetical protein